MSAAKKISIEQLRNIFFDHEDEEVSLQHIAEDCGLASARELAEALSDLLHIPLVEIPEECHIERSLIELVPEAIAHT